MILLCDLNFCCVILDLLIFDLGVCRVLSLFFCFFILLLMIIILNKNYEVFCMRAMMIWGAYIIAFISEEDYIYVLVIVTKLNKTS